MRSLILFFGLFLLSIPLMSQECHDKIYPVSGTDTCIVDCCILEVKYGNVVSFIKDNERHLVEATRIVKDGKSYMLEADTPNPDFNVEESKTVVLKDEPGQYRGHDYEYYRTKYKGATQQWGLGIALTITGAAANITSIIFATDDNSANDGPGVMLNIYGIIAFNIGLPLWISGGIKRANNRRAMKMAKANTGSVQSLKIGTTAHGIGFSLNF